MGTVVPVVLCTISIVGQTACMTIEEKPVLSGSAHSLGAAPPRHESSTRACTWRCATKIFASVSTESRRIVCGQPCCDGRRST